MEMFHSVNTQMQFWVLFPVWPQDVTDALLCSRFQVLLVLFAQQHSDLVELGSLRRLFGPAALHQLTQLGAVTLRVDGRP